MKYYEIQEFEAWVRSVLASFNVKEDVIDSLIGDDIYIQNMKEEEARKAQGK